MPPPDENQTIEQTPAPGAAAPAAGGEGGGDAGEATFDKAFETMAKAGDADPAAGGEEDAAAPAAGGAAAPAAGDKPEDEPGAGAAPAGGEKKPGEGDDDKPEDDDAPLDETVPEGLTEKASARFKELLEDRKTARAELKEVQGTAAKLQGAFAEMTAWVKETGATPEEFQAQVDRLRIFNKGTPDELKSLRAELLDAVRDISTRLGDEPPGIDPLEGHDDLKKEVEDLKITRERAVELATQRNRDKRHTRVSEATRQADTRQQQARDYQAAVRTAQDGIRKLEAQWKKTDPDAVRKIKVILQDLPDFKFIPPDQWVATVKRRYENLSGLTPKPKPSVKQPVAGAGAKPGGTAAQPSTLLGLMDTMTER